MAETIKNFYGASHTGYKRIRNEDRYLIKLLQNDRAILLGVADGMGGEPGGDISAQMVTDILQEYQPSPNPTEKDLADILEKAGKKIQCRAQKEIGLEGMGTTATLALVAHDMAYWSHVGDSRLYLYRDGRLTQITSDHVFIQELIDDGTLSKLDAERHPLRNMLDQCVGCMDMAPDSGRFPLLPGDKLLLCSDGLTRQVLDDKIKEVLENDDARTITELLVEKALEAGGRDNVTVVALVISIGFHGPQNPDSFVF
jgi:PPM family protein phosphatase